MKDVKHWLDSPELDFNSKQKKFNEHHVYFQEDQKEVYIKLIFGDMLSSQVCEVTPTE